MGGIKMECESTHNGWKCTRPAGHDGEHQAYRLMLNEYEIWGEQNE